MGVQQPKHTIEKDTVYLIGSVTSYYKNKGENLIQKVCELQ